VEKQDTTTTQFFDLRHPKFVVRNNPLSQSTSKVFLSDKEYDFDLKAFVETELGPGTGLLSFVPSR
jgi:hypothetical protein